MERSRGAALRGPEPVRAQEQAGRAGQASRRAHDAQRRARQSELDRARAARGVLPAGRIRAWPRRDASRSARISAACRRSEALPRACAPSSPNMRTRRATRCSRAGSTTRATRTGSIRISSSANGWTACWATTIRCRCGCSRTPKRSCARTSSRSSSAAMRRAAAIDLFAVEGASAGITYVFQSLVHSRLLAPGDCIALGRADLHAVSRSAAAARVPLRAGGDRAGRGCGLALPGGADRQARAIRG